MMTQKDEINNDRHLNMNFTEFIEAICRVADRLSIPNLSEETVENEDFANPEYCKEWFQKPTHEKIESYLLILAKNCLSEKYYEENLKNLKAMKALKNIYSNDMEVPNSYTGKVTQTVKILTELSEHKTLMLQTV